VEVRLRTYLGIHLEKLKPDESKSHKERLGRKQNFLRGYGGPQKNCMEEAECYTFRALARNDIR